MRGGEVAADALAAAIKGKTGNAAGEVAIITSLPGVGSLDQRAQGFKQELAKYPDLKLIANRIADGQVTTGLNIMSDLLTAHPKLVGVFASNLQMVEGASQALGEAGRAKQVALVGFDSDKSLVQALRSGVIAALIVQNPFRMGYEGIKIADQAAHGKPVPKQVDTGVTAITAANLDTPASKALLDPTAP